MTTKTKFTDNLAEAVSSIIGQLDQLKAELEEAKMSTDRVSSITNALKEIAPECE